MSDDSKPERFRTFLILGAPGSGKGTQGKVLGSIPRFHHFAPSTPAPPSVKNSSNTPVAGNSYPMT